MKSSESIEKLYKIFEDIKGSTEAKNTITSLIYNIIDDLQSSKIPVTAEAIEEGLFKYVKDFSGVQDEVA